MIHLLLDRWTSRSRRRDAVRRVARACQNAAFARCRERLPEMTLAEARGYVRARSGSLVRTQVAELVRHQQLAAADMEEIVERVVRLLIESVISQHLQHSRQRHVLRRAA